MGIACVLVPSALVRAIGESDMAIIRSVTQVIGGVSIDTQVKLCGNGEYVVRVRKTGERRWYAPADYFTNDKRDAIDTASAMAHNYRESLK